MPSYEACVAVGTVAMDHSSHFVQIAMDSGGRISVSVPFNYDNSCDDYCSGMSAGQKIRSMSAIVMQRC